MPAHPLYDAVAVGCGPSNLSFAALATEVPGLRIAVLESDTAMRWHPGLMLPGAKLQVSPWKDLVSLASPTNPHSFLNYLVSSGRIHRFLVSSRSAVSRREFEQYYAWAADRVGTVRFGQTVRSVERAPEGFRVHTDRATWRARNLVLGAGRPPRVPAQTRPFLGDGVFHAHDYLRAPRRTGGARVLVVGGGQSAAEIVNHLLSGPGALPSELVWATGRIGLPPLDDSPFSNDWYTPGAVRHFHRAGPKVRARLLEALTYTSDGVSEDLLADIYRRLYELDYVDDTAFRHAVLPGYRLDQLGRAERGYEAVLSGTGPGDERLAAVDTVILATGYASGPPAFLAPLLDELPRHDDGNFRTRADFRLDTETAPAPPGELTGTGGIWVQNAARHSHGVADPNLSLSAWRSAVILNSLTGRQVFRTDGFDTTFDFEPAGGPAPALRAHAVPALDEGTFLP
ncbi:lysine N(6)-hydroxylase/L-ornithine N(5)-oxygenase family protein [Streptomyces genisteinicus]|uniref:L-lysine N6-monooxygenase MbtG n=1 Tax=Streptomyces genisteinicus TaxID=2768068 RepID=A0A7H0HZH6_9ACTN|nr:SidA/IucD/PvdA family monooxygenase [Streptomyces genisteinicus]QNP65942.1 SidA/IucD/PvdA family monooxygenase [Streptomyces genisteinicus]